MTTDEEVSEATTDYRHPDWAYVNRRLNDLRWELQGLHRKIDEIERLRYYEMPANLSPAEVKTGQEVKSGLTDNVLENIKASVLAGRPQVHVHGLRKKQNVETNNSKREKFWQSWINSMSYPVNHISELADAQLLGLGVFKVAMMMGKWQTQQLKKKRGENSDDHIDRAEALKKFWGPPLGAITVHPIASYFEPGEGGKVEEFIEHSYKSKYTVYETFGINDQGQFDNPDIIKTLPGQPDWFIRPMPIGVDTTNYFLVTEYWNPRWYQVYVNGKMVYEEENPSVAYFIAPGRTSSSKDPDKYGQSPVENLRHNEPLIDRQLSRMIEATELIVNKRNTLEVPEGYIPETDGSDDGTTKPRTWTFRDDYAEALPPGAKIKDPFEGVEAAYQAMPLVQMLFQIASQHSPSPVLKGISPGAAGSGYRDNSLYLMSRQQYDYIVVSLQECIGQAIRWAEWCLCYCIKQEIFIGENSLQPSDIEGWPAEISVELKPELPQNLLAEGQFWEGQREAGNVSRRYVREKGLGIEQPDEMEYEVRLEKAQEALDPYLLMDAMKIVLNMGPAAQGQAPNGLVGPDGKTPISSQASGMTPGNSTTTNGRMEGGNAQQAAGFATGGQSRMPTQEPGQFPPGNMENR